MNHPEWSRKACIYEVNTRQFTHEGTFAAFEKHLPRIKELNVDILWFMPVYPIGNVKRQGTLGSYYAIKDYMDINPEFGTLSEFKSLVKKIHDMGMYVLMDWVANHTAWDNELVYAHPEWYHRDHNGNVIAPFEWYDVAHLNYNNADLRRYMIHAMQFWVKEADIDGFRCDVADLVPTDFWEEARTELDKIKPVFMLAEAEVPILNRHAFDMSYASKFHKLMKSIANGEKKAYEIMSYFNDFSRDFPHDTYLMHFTSNHDENSWNGTEYESFGNSIDVFTTLIFVLPGMPLIYGGQESELNKRLKFFDKDEIEWKPSRRANMLQALTSLKKSNSALWNGAFGSPLTWVNTTRDDKIFSFLRIKGLETVFCIFNLSGEMLSFEFKDYHYVGTYRELFTGEIMRFQPYAKYMMAAWDCKIFVRI